MTVEAERDRPVAADRPGDEPPVRRPRRRPSVGLTVPVVAGAALIYLTVFPLGWLVLGSFQTQKGPPPYPLTLHNYATAYGTSTTYETLLSSVIFAVGSSVLAFVLATGLAWLVERTDLRFRRLALPVVIAPLVLPGVLLPIAWIFLLDPRAGYVNLALQKVFGFDSGPLNVFSMPGMIWVQAVSEVPLAFLMMAAAFKLTDPALEESAMMSGAGTASTLRRVTLPLLRPWAAAVLLLLVIRSLESFEVPSIIGIPARVQVYTSEIYLAYSDFPPDYGRASSLAVGLLLLSVLGVWLYLRASRNSDRYATVSGKAFRSRRIELGRLRRVGDAALLLYALLVVALPILVTAWASLLPFFATPTTGALKLVSLDNYRALASDATVRTAFRNSVVLGVLAATIVTALTAVVAWIRHRSRLRGVKSLEFLAMIPIAVPGLVLGMGLIVMYVALPVPIYGTLWILLIAYCTKYLPYGMRSASGSIVQLRVELEEAASMSGSTWWQSFRRVTLPLLRPGLVAGWIYIFVVSMREFSTSILLVTGQSNVLSVVVFTKFENGEVTGVAALGIVMIAVSTLAIGLVYKISGRVGVQA
jgi:iron(III) transport system permease protein